MGELLIRSGCAALGIDYGSSRSFTRTVHDRLFPDRFIFQDARNQGSMHGVSSAVGYHFADNAFSQQGQVANQIQYLVAHKFIGIAQGPVLNAFARQHNHIFFIGPSDQAHVAQRNFILKKAEGARRGDLAQIRAAGELDFKSLLADGLGEIDRVRDRISIRWIYSDELFSIAHLHFLADSQVGAAAALLADARVLDHADKRLGAAIQNRQFKIVQFNDGIINARTHEGGKQVFGGGNQHAFFHQAGGITYFGHVAADSFNLIVIQIGAAENNPAPRGCRQDAQRNRRSTVQSCAFALYRAANCLFVEQSRTQKLNIRRVLLDFNPFLSRKSRPLCDCKQVDYTFLWKTRCGKNGTLRVLYAHNEAND